MGYGIKILGTDGGGNFVVKDTDQNTINYQVISSGSAQSLASSNFPGDARLFINGNVGSSNTNKFITIDRNSGNTFKTVGFSGTLGGNIQNITYTTCTVNYLVLQKMSAISNSGGNYGIQILTSAGAVAFDSRRILTNTSFFFTGDTKQPNVVDGDGGTISNDGDIYCDANILFEFASNSASAIRWRGTGVGTNRVEYLHFRSFSGRTSSTSYIRNFGTILTGKIR